MRSPTFAASLTDAQWKTRCMPDGRTVGVIVHHVGFVYPIEIDIAQTIANGKPITGLTMDDVHALNAKHAVDNAAVTKEEAIALCAPTAPRPPRRSARSATNNSHWRFRRRSIPTRR